MPFPVAVCVVVPAKDGRLLAVTRRKSSTQWGLPGGKVDDGESSLTAVVRECEEECGVQLAAADLVPLYAGKCGGEGDTSYWVTTFLYDGPPVCPDEVRAVTEDFAAGWVPWESLTDPATSPFAAYNQEVYRAWRIYANTPLEPAEDALQLVRFKWDCGRMGDVSGLFIATRHELEAAYGRAIEFGEILGKHSHVAGVLEKSDISVVSEDPALLRTLVDSVGWRLGGYCPLDYFPEE